MLLLFIAGPLLVWWANRTSTMERHGAKPAEPEDATTKAPRVEEDRAPSAPLQQETREGTASTQAAST